MKFRLRSIAAATAIWLGVPFGIPGPTRIRADPWRLFLQLRGFECAVRWDFPSTEVIDTVKPEAPAAADGPPIMHQRRP